MIYNQLIITRIIYICGTLESSSEHNPTSFKVILINEATGIDNNFRLTPKFIGSSAING